MTTMKKNIGFCFLTSLIFILPACQSPETRAVNQNNSQDTSFQNDEAGTGSKEANNSVEPGGNAPTDNNYSQKTKVSDNDKQFMDAVKTSGTMEISLAKQAQQSSNPKIKSFADMMIKDHTQLDKDAEALATESKIILRTNFDNDQLAQMEKLKGLKGAAFDQQYKDMMIKGHAKTIELFKTGIDTRDDKVKEFAKKYLPVIESHHAAAMAL